MSNLLKVPFTVIQKEDCTRIIDSNELVEQRVLAMVREQGAQESPEGFRAGLAAEEVELPPEEEEDPIDYEALAQEMLDKARSDADAIINMAYGETEKIRDNARIQGREEGYQDGLEQGMAQIREKEGELEQYKASLEAEYQDKVAGIEPMLVDTIASVFEQVFTIQFADRKDMILHIVKKAVRNIENSKEFLIKVPGENLEYVFEHKEEIQDQVGQAVSIEIVSDNSLTDNQCIIETDSGVFDCSLDIQLENLVKSLKTLCVSA